MRILVVTLVLITAAITPARAADDPAANVILRAFMGICIPDMGYPDRIRAYAQDNHLPVITDTTALTMFSGSEDKGEAWALPSPYGNFALSIRSKTQACAVWARHADPQLIETDFRKIVEGSKRPGLDLTIYQDKTTTGPYGKNRELVYLEQIDGANWGFAFTMLTAEHDGGPFQASLQVARFVTPPSSSTGRQTGD